jgi:hypothetical protein
MLTMMIWLFVGPLAMVLTLVSIVQRGTGWTTFHDGLFFVFLLLSVAARWIDAINGDPLTSGGEATSTRGARQYTMLVVGAGVAAWVVANAIGNHLLK